METLKTFCALRAESVSGQLAGTIPSTAEGQSAAGDALVETDGLILSAMGAMDMGGDLGGGFGGPGGGGRPEFGRGTENRPEGPLGPSGQPGSMKMGLLGENGLPQSASLDGQTIFLLAASVLVLLTGILLAWGYRRHGRQRKAGRPAETQENSACCRR